jgi:hypothetical protein
MVFTYSASIYMYADSEPHLLLHCSEDAACAYINLASEN